ncbi:MAG: hypothetical protein K2K63_14540 [Acetatifactor sp.]|nr:hypothetical protein [Acetatifactor sp.]
MKKRIVLMCIFLLTNMITACSSGKSELEVKNISSEVSSDQISQEDSSDVSKQHHMDDDVIGNENTTELTVENSLNIIDIEQIEKEGGKVEFADIMTYENFQNLGWTNDVDAGLDKDEKVYIVKIYYPEGFEHAKVGKIENCEAIGIYSIEDGTYLGGCFRERQ